MINSGMTVRELTVQLPQSTRLFEKLKIDYCCGGDKLLAEACLAAGLEVNSVMQMLEEYRTRTDEPAPDFQQVSLGELITHILDKHHVYTKEAIERIQSLMMKVVAAHGLNHPELSLQRGLFERLCDDLTPHMFKEERVLFPYILNMEDALSRGAQLSFPPFGTVNNPIRMMMMEHDNAGDLLRELRALSCEYTVPADACSSYQALYRALEDFEKDLHQHIHLENNFLFPRAIEMERQSAGNMLRR
jgi:regulator of cell morphogenesis and NO signaling